MSRKITQGAARLLCAAMLAGAASAGPGAGSSASGVVRIAVFEFELQDATPAAANGVSTSSRDSLMKATAAAREQLGSSGRYSIVSVERADDEPARNRQLRNCEGCEAAIAHRLGAQQSMIGIVSRATQTDYYVTIVIRDAGTGEVLDTQSANFAGGEEGWASGVRMLIRHQVLAQ